MSRLDRALVDRRLLNSRSRAAREIAAGRVSVNGRTASKASQDVKDTDDVTVTEPDPWVARSAHKLLGALDAFDLTDRLNGLTALDAGASTGGFTQVLLTHGVAQVWAVDVGHDQLAPVLRDDPRVHVREGLNLRELADSTCPPSTSSSPTSPSSPCACSSARCWPPPLTPENSSSWSNPNSNWHAPPWTNTESSPAATNAAAPSTPCSKQ